MNAYCIRVVALSNNDSTDLITEIAIDEEPLESLYDVLLSEKVCSEETHRVDKNISLEMPNRLMSLDACRA